MITASIVKFLRANILEFTYSAFVKDADTVISEQVKPICVVHELTTIPEQWEIGDSHRRHNVKIQVAIYHKNKTDLKFLTMKVIKALETATAIDSSGTSVPGVNLYGVWDLLANPSGDLKNYTSDQPGWFATPTPVVYANGDLSTNILAPALYSVAFPTGVITFSAVRAVADKIYATYKCGVVDFTIGDIANQPIFQVGDIANKLHKYNTVITLNTWFFIKKISNKIL